MLRTKSALLLAVFLASAAVSSAGRKATFLIVEHPGAFTIFNQYQQRVSEQESSTLPQFIPFAILNADDVLGDGFTACMKVEVGGTIFFLGKEEDGTMQGGSQSGLQRFVRDASAIGDTIEILRSNRLTFTDPRQVQSSFLDEGMRVVRVFRNGGLTYVKLLGASQLYGWVNFESAVQGRDWGYAKLVGVALADQLQKVLPQMQRKVKDVNAKLTMLFEHFNKTSFERKAPPEWKVEQSGLTLRCILFSDISSEKFSETTQALAKTFESFVLGSELRVIAAPGRIEVRK